MSKHDNWLEAAENACSYRRMYALALEISSTTADPPLKAAAEDVVMGLKNVARLGLDSADQLQEGRRRFTVLINVLACDDVVEQYTPKECSTSKQVEELLCRIQEEVASKTAHGLPAARIMRSDMRPVRKASPRTW